MIETVSSRTGEWAFIYARPHGHDVDLLIVSHDHSDTAVVRAVVDATMFMQDFGSPNSLSHAPVERSYLKAIQISAADVASATIVAADALNALKCAVASHING